MSSNHDACKVPTEQSIAPLDHSLTLLARHVTTRLGSTGLGSTGLGSAGTIGG